jgi:hypothetical protein
MSDVKATGFKKMKCADIHHADKEMLSDVGAGFVDLQIVGTDVNVSGAKTGASITAITGDYSPGVDANGDACTNPDGTFLITIETDAATYFVTLLFDGSDFIITPTQSTAYLGQWYPARLISVNVGTTGDFCVGY